MKKSRGVIEILGLIGIALGALSLGMGIFQVSVAVESLIHRAEAKKAAPKQQAAEMNEKSEKTRVLS